MSEITEEEIIKLMITRGLTIEKITDAIIKSNAIIGVGLITLSDQLCEAVKATIRKHH